jgi:hypothetical protein
MGFGNMSALGNLFADNVSRAQQNIQHDKQFLDHTKNQATGALRGLGGLIEKAPAPVRDRLQHELNDIIRTLRHNWPRQFPWDH